MPAFKKTKLQKFDFGDLPDDLFYILVDLNVSPKGIDTNKIRLSDPRNFDATLRELGCLLMFTGSEIEELGERGEIDKTRLHRSLYELGVREGVIKSGG